MKEFYLLQLTGKCFALKLHINFPLPAEINIRSYDSPGLTSTIKKTKIFLLSCPIVNLSFVISI